MPVSSQWEIRRIIEREAARLAVDLAALGVAADHLRGLHIERMRRVKRLI